VSFLQGFSARQEEEPSTAVAFTLKPSPADTKIRLLRCISPQAYLDINSLSHRQSLVFTRHTHPGRHCNPSDKFVFFLILRDVPTFYNQLHERSTPAKQLKLNMSIAQSRRWIGAETDSQSQIRQFSMAQLVIAFQSEPDHILSVMVLSSHIYIDWHRAGPVAI
jgi:hypothetical protein